MSLVLTPFLVKLILYKWQRKLAASEPRSKTVNSGSLWQRVSGCPAELFLDPEQPRGTRNA